MLPPAHLGAEAANVARAFRRNMGKNAVETDKSGKGYESVKDRKDLTDWNSVG